MAISPNPSLPCTTATRQQRHISRIRGRTKSVNAQRPVANTLSGVLFVKSGAADDWYASACASAVTAGKGGFGMDLVEGGPPPHQLRPMHWFGVAVVSVVVYAIKLLNDQHPHNCCLCSGECRAISRIYIVRLRSRASWRESRSVHKQRVRVCTRFYHAVELQVRCGGACDAKPNSLGEGRHFSQHWAQPHPMTPPGVSS